MRVTDLPTDKEMEDQDKGKENKDEKEEDSDDGDEGREEEDKVGGQQRWYGMSGLGKLRSDQKKELIIELPRPWWQAKEISVDDQTLFWEDEEMLAGL